ncbi:hypothetical protein [Algibacter sp. L4_22]|uniref:hypothetical protein n=1 Tax=Algibacter sp. L4_22 TaxID=2942477 RepID=UPI0034D15DBD
MGNLTALSLAEKGHTVYVHRRSEAKVDAVVSEIKTITNNQSIHGLVTDFSIEFNFKASTLKIRFFISKATM